MSSRAPRVAFAAPLPAPGPPPAVTSVPVLHRCLQRWRTATPALRLTALSTSCWPGCWRRAPRLPDLRDVASGLQPMPQAPARGSCSCGPRLRANAVGLHAHRVRLHAGLRWLHRARVAAAGAHERSRSTAGIPNSTRSGDGVDPRHCSGRHPGRYEQRRRVSLRSRRRLGWSSSVSASAPRWRRVVASTSADQNVTIRENVLRRWQPTSTERRVGVPPGARRASAADVRPANDPQGLSTSSQLTAAKPAHHRPTSTWPQPVRHQGRARISAATSTTTTRPVRCW